jgi:uncharacterized LabA/DUF88 family protein
MSERVMIFIDGSNIFWACKRIRSDFKVDYKKLVDELVGERRLIRPNFYCAIGVPPTPQQIKFHDSLKFQGFNVVTKPLKIRPKGSIEKGVDVSLVTDMLKFAFMNVLDVCILVSGDNDFAEAVKIVKDRGIRVEIAAFEHSIGRDLRMLADKFTSIDSIVSKIEQK